MYSTCRLEDLELYFQIDQNELRRRTKGSEGDGAAHQPHLQIPPGIIHRPLDVF